MDPWVNIASLLKAKNNEGGLSVKQAEGLPFLLQPGMEVTFVPPVLRMPRSAVVEQVVEMGQGRHMVYFDAIVDRTQAEKLEGHFCLVPYAALPEGFDKQQGSGLVGFNIVDEAAGPVGVVADVLENPAHPLLEVRTQAEGAQPDATVFIPLVEEFIVGVDEQSNTLTMNLPAGLLDL